MRSKDHRNDWINALCPAIQPVKPETDKDFKLTANEENVEVDKEVTAKCQVAAVKIRSLEQVELNALLRSERIATTSQLLAKVKENQRLTEVLTLQAQAINAGAFC
jgi:hypothetical protein